MVARRVALIFGPPGAGKTTLAKSLGLDVYDRDDQVWSNDEARFREALRRVGRDPNAQAAVIRTGATLRARNDAEAMCNATEIHILDTPAAVCVERIRKRKRGNIRPQLAGVKTWWDQYEPTTALHGPLGSTSRAW